MPISESEKIVMDVLWSESPLTANQIIEHLDASLKWNDKTVKTLINRLLKKNAIQFEKNGREYLYSPVLKQHAYIHSVSRKFIQNFFGGSLSSLVSNFAKQEALDQTEINELKAFLQTISEAESKSNKPNKENK